ncbi:MAG: PEP-CTERM sorting domain-containing protein [Phycisphaerae bacterium]|nr:PEP-CTERM sorting domain-containing protein [Phycisphaerae bacterium]
MREKRNWFLGAILVVLLFVFVPSAFAVPTYMSVSSGYDDYTTGSAIVYNSGKTTDYGTAKIEWHSWSSMVDGTKYWYYAYKVYNNEVAGGSPDPRSNDYHYGHTYVYSTQAPSFASQNSFDLVFGIDIPGDYQTTADLYVVSTNAGSSKSGSSPWLGQITQTWLGGDDWVMTGIDWSATGGGGNTIDPTQWNKKGGSWNLYYAGDTSKDDSIGQYFEIASTWEPGKILSANITDGFTPTNTVLSGEVWGPKVAPVPEPATIAIFAIGMFGIVLRRRHK